jgi:hypothetical protein
MEIIPAKLDELKTAMENDSELKKFITTKGYDFPKNKRILFDEIGPFANSTDLYYLMERAIADKELNLECLFSITNGGTYEGFIAYQIRGNEAINITMFPLHMEQDYVSFQEGLKELIQNVLLPKYDKIKWTALKRNPASSTYRKILNEFNGHQNPPFDDKYPNLGEIKIKYLISKTPITATEFDFNTWHNLKDN